MVFQGELNKRHACAVKLQMVFNINKCSTIHVGRRNRTNRYTLNGIDIGTSNSKKDLGVHAGESELEVH